MKQSFSWEMTNIHKPLHFQNILKGTHTRD